MEIDKFARQIPITDNVQGTEAYSILRGLRTGEYERFGGVIRKSAGSPDGGEIVGHLRDIVPGREQGAPLGMPNGPSLGGQGTKMLSKTLQMSQVAAAASVLNLGVSVAGFAYMAKRMNDLQRDLATLDRKMESRFDRVDEQLEAVLYRLEEVREIVLSNQVQGEVLREEIRALRNAVLGQQKSRLVTALEMVDLGQSSLEEHLKTFKEVRHAMEDELKKPAPLRDARRLIDVGVRFRVWATAAAAEALALANLQKREEAAQQYSRHGETALNMVRSWVKQGLPEGDWTIWAHRRFDETVSDERRNRLARSLNPSEPQARRRRKEGQGAVRNDAHVSGLDDDRKRQYDGLAALADTAVEVGERLQSNGIEVRRCMKADVSLDEWQQVGKGSDSPVLLVPSSEDWS